MDKKKYKFNIKIELEVKDVENVDEALQYADQWISDGLSMISNSDDTNDDHYELMAAMIDSFQEVY